MVNKRVMTEQPVDDFRNLIAENEELKQTVERYAKMIHERDVMIQQMSKFMIDYAIRTIVLSKNAEGIIAEDS